MRWSRTLSCLAVVAAVPAGASVASAHGPGGASATIAAEQAALGVAHAAEHEELRRLQRSPGWRRAVRRARVTARAIAAGRPDRTGRWRRSFDIPVFAINAIVLPTGKVLWFAYPNNQDRPPGPRDEAHAWLWNPAEGTRPRAFKQVDPPTDPATGKPVNIWCGGNSLLADGRVLVTGGNLRYPVQNPTTGMYSGLNHVYTFDPFSETWTRQPDMRHGRWYPSQLLLPDGRTVIMGGLDESGHGTKNTDLEVFTPSRRRNGVGRMTLLGSQPDVGDYYPHMFWMPNGRALVAGPYTNDSYWLLPPFSSARVRWRDIGNTSRARVWGSAVMVPGGTRGPRTVAQFGGSDLPALLPRAVASAEVFDARRSDWDAATGRRPYALRRPRSHHNTVLLPDGTMATVGGGWGAGVVGANGSPGQWAADPFHLSTELWNPRTRKWRLGAPQREYRAYHSTAVLLPDGRVVSAGDDFNGRFGDGRDFTQDSAEIFEPPYLFDGRRRAPRPALRGAPKRMRYKRAYRLRVRRARGTRRAVTRAVLMAPSATTHAVDMNQRYVPLKVKRRSDRTLIVKAPAKADIALPGYHMLFVLDRAGTPSVARWVRLGRR